ncbi:predicted protein [Meyerozyma guilliermondii ATCC 6260]|uniref:F-box domain-containing protein n=1 Tax=Meyerozyma guilliermondii (strain ATCC 6260 / CBS 566 / DSM 6381 / JCM 1539 / NBRC 10279 / NRRL Y-324) TaxID=294746 RepID=A5DQX0_PICGU|nr:uncharacterized protein PGUG_05671 [Meyerozyma guilliermondii ATCC 6260]EDK41573.2 predicted protein [Meyerozyma guilliermondii ATCC 6260]
MLNMNSLPYEIVIRCFPYLSTEVLTNIILLENIPDIILEAAANNLNYLWYAKRIRGIYGDVIGGIEDHYETDFDRFLHIHKTLEKKSFKCPLRFHYTWENIFEMQQNLDEINLAYSGQKLCVHVDLIGQALQICPTFSDHDINLKITSLSLKTFFSHFECSIDLNKFPNLETFYGSRCKMWVYRDHPSLKNLYLNKVTFSSLPTNLKKLVAKWCKIRMNENHPKLEALRVLDLNCKEEPFNYSSLMRILWNKDLEHFSFIGQGVTDEDEIFSMLGPKVTSFGFSGSSFSRIPTSIRSLNCNGNVLFHNRIGSQDLSAFTHMTSLTFDVQQGSIDGLQLPPNLLKLSIAYAEFEDLAKVEFPPTIVDLELRHCQIESTAGWLKPARLKRLSLQYNKLSSFNAILPCCEFLSLRSNSLMELRLKLPFLSIST